MKRWLLLLMLLAWASVAHAQTLASGSITTNGQALTAGISPGGAPIVGHSVQVTGTWTGTLTFQASVDGSTYVSLLGSNVASGASASSTTANGVFSFTNGGYRSVRVTATAAMTGTAVVTINQGYAGGGGGGASGSVTQGTSPWVVAGEYANDGAAAGTNRVNVNDGLVETSAPTRTNGRNAGASYTAGGSQRVMIADAAGAAVTVATDVPEDAAETAGGTGPFVMSVRRDTAASSAGTTGDNASFNTDSIGRLWVSGAVVEDAAETAADSLVSVGTVRRDAPASSAGTTGDNATMNTSALGAVYVATVDPCSYKAKSYYVVNLAATGTVEVANAVANEFWYICSVNLVAQGANAFLIASDDTDGCGSLTAGLNGGTAAATGWGFAANGGIALGNGNATVMKSATANHYLCIAPSTTAQISGTIAYVSAP